MKFKTVVLPCLALAGAFTQLACRRDQAAGPPPHFAVLRFENLTGDKTLDWTSRAASEVLAVAIESGMEGPVLRTASIARFVQAAGGRPSAAPGVSTERTAALLAGANRVITGYVEQAGGGLRITAVEENISTGTTVHTFSATAGSFDAALRQLASQFTSKPKPYLTAKADAIKFYSTALEEAVEPGIRDFRKALEADPDFGPAWVSLALLDAARGDRPAFENTVTAARARKLDDFSRAQLDLQDSALLGDNKLRIASMRKIVDMSPGDTTLLRSLGEAETAAGDFKNAAADTARLATLAPTDGAVWNNLGYARSYTGDYAGALAALQEYARLRPADANPLDSLGDVNYQFRKFAEAAAAYAQATQKDPNFEGGADLYKAAWAKFRAGDKTGADALMTQFRTAREKQADVLIPLLEADWLYRTGRAPQAMALLRKTAAAPKTPEQRASALAQIVVWELLAGDRAKAVTDLAEMGRPTSVPGLLATFAAMPSASAAEWEARAQRLFPAPQMLIVRRAALGYALLLDGKREAALPLWKDAAAAAPADFLTASLVARLEGRTPDIEPVPNPANVNQFRAVLDSLNK